jgi:hypothetical protein
LKVLIDENLPPAMAKALAALFEGTHEIIHLRQRFGPSVHDAEWISVVSAEGRWVVISADRRITRNKAEQRVFKASRLVGFFFPPSLTKAKLTKQMERLMALWETIEKQSDIAAGGAIFELPMRSIRVRPI